MPGVSSFTWIDGERLIRFGPGAIGAAADILGQRGFDGYVLLTTARAERSAPALVEGAVDVVHVPPGTVPEAAATVSPGVHGRPLVALGGGRVVDVAKAIGGVEGLACAAIPTTLAGSPMTPFHRLPAGSRGGRMIRPAVVIWDPDLSATLDRAALAATAMNALAHALEALYTPLANPVAELAALRGAELLAHALPEELPDAVAVSLAALLAGYAVGSTGFAVHHAICQTIVRTCGTPHAETNAVMLPHTAELMAHRAPAAVGRFAGALGDVGRDPANASGRVARLVAETGLDGLGELGVAERDVPAIADAAAAHPAMQSTPGGAPPGSELRDLLLRAL